MKIPNKNYEVSPPFIFKWRGLIMAAAAAGVLAAAAPTLNSCAVGFAAVLSGELLRLWALGWTGEHTRSQELKAPQLVTGGPYRFVRNPLYLGNIISALGVLAAAAGAMPAFSVFCMFACGAVVLYLVYASCIISEEAFLAIRFGDIFFDYRAATPAILPRCSDLVRIFTGQESEAFRLGSASCAEGDPSFRWQALRFETSTLIWLTLVCSFLLCRA